MLDLNQVAIELQALLGKLAQCIIDAKTQSVTKEYKETLQAVVDYSSNALIEFDKGAYDAGD